jgi:fatty acid desaturase
MTNKKLKQLSYKHSLLQISIVVLLAFLGHLLFYNVSFYLLPLVLIIYTNVFMRLFSLGHDGIHGLLSRKKTLNEFIARYLCHAPILFSFSRYRHLHLLHHKYVGTKYDPDNLIDINTPKTIQSYLLYTIKRVLIFNQLYTAILFYTDITRVFQSKNAPKFSYKQDSIQLLIFWLFLGVLGGLYSGIFKFLMLWCFCLLFFPLVVEFFSLIQHRNLNETNKTISRDIEAKSFLSKVLFPAGIAHHGIHHEDTTIPWYNLDKIKRGDMNHSDVNLSQALKEIFK